jgi:hypothetical protein
MNIQPFSSVFPYNQPCGPITIWSRFTSGESTGPMTIPVLIKEPKMGAAVGVAIAVAEATSWNLDWTLQPIQAFITTTSPMATTGSEGRDELEPRNEVSM